MGIGRCSWQDSGIIFAAMVVCASALWAYWPSLAHAPKHDQLAYLANAARKTSLSSLTVGSYDLNRKSRVDPHLFRPLLYVFLGFETWLFRYDFALWHLTGLALHLWVVMALFGLLSQFRRGWPAFWGAAFFTLMLTNTPMVNWEHINAYMIFSALVLSALREILVYVQSHGEKTGSALLAVLLLGCSAFIFEAGALFSFVLFAVFLGASFKDRLFRKSVLLWSLPCIVYIAASVIHLAVFYRFPVIEAGNIAQSALSLPTIAHYVQALKWFFLGGIFAQGSDMAETVRTGLLAETLDWSWPFGAWKSSLLPGLGVAGIAGAGVVCGWSTDFIRRRKMILLILGSFLLSYVAFVVLGRVNTRGIVVGLLFNAYYFYIFWILLIPFLFALIDWDRLTAFLSYRIVRALAIGVLAGVMIVNVFSIRHVNILVAHDHAQTRGLMRTIDALILRHKTEPGFSFGVAPGTCRGDELEEWFQHQGFSKDTRYTLSQVLYPQYFRKEHPAYVINCRAE